MQMRKEKIMKNKKSGQSNKTLIVILSIVVVLCVVGAALLVLHIRNTEEKPIDGVDTTETDNTDTETEIENSKPEFEISEDGVLTAYNGEAETVVIPDNIISIEADAFGTSSYAEEIKTVKLGKSVEDIDVRAFVSLTKLENVEVPEENSNFISGDGVLIKTDNSVFFCMPSIIKDNYDMFDVFFDVISYKIDGTGESKLVSGGMVAEIEREYAEPDNPVNRKYYISCNSFSAKGQTMIVDKSIIREYKGLNYIKPFYAYVTNECVVYSNISNDGFGNTWLFTDNEIIRVEVIDSAETKEKINGEEWYNNSVITFMKGEDGSLNYIRRPRKYVGVGGTYDCAVFWTGLDEFAYEEGYVKIENGKLIYKLEKSLTAKEYGLDETYITSLFNLKSEEELNEYFSGQAQKYESAK